jgi:hypothetical protein
MADGQRKQVRTLDLAIAGAIGYFGVLAIRWLFQHPEHSRTIYMRGCLITQKSCHEFADKFRIVADKAGTEYNRMRVNV